MPSPDKLTPLRRIRSGRAGYAQARAPDKLRLRRISSARPDLIRRTSLNFFFFFERMSAAKSLPELIRRASAAPDKLSLDDLGGEG